MEISLAQCMCACELLIRMAYVIYEDSAVMCAAFEKLAADPPTLADKQLRLMKYDPSVEWPTGNHMGLCSHSKGGLVV